MSAESVQQRKYVWGVDDLPAGLRVDDYVEEAHQIWMQLIQTVNESNPGNRYFWYSVFSSRDPFACSLLLDLSILLAILDNRSTFQDVLVSIPGQAEPFLFQTLHRLGIQVKVQSNEPGPQVSSLRKKWQDWRSFLQNVWLPLIKQKASAPPKPVFKSDPVWLFDTFVSLDNAGELQKDRYFTTIVSEDTIPRHSYFTYSPLHSDTRRLRSVLSKDWRKWLHKESFLSWADYLRALTIPRKLSGIRVPAIILTESELDFSPLVQSMLVRYRFDDMSVYGFLCERFIAQLVKHVSIKAFIDWYENQMMDRGLHAGFARHSPQTVRIGYQPGHPVRAHFNQYTTDLESSAGVAPDALAAIRSAYRGFTRYRNQPIGLVSIPAFRAKMARSAESSWERPSSTNCVVCLPLMLAEAEAIMDGMEQWVQPQDRLRFHPMHTPADQKTLLSGHSKIEIDRESSLAEAMCDAGLCVTSASQTALDVLAMGRPVIIKARTGRITYHSVPAFAIGKFCKVIYNSAQMQEALEDLRGVWKSSAAAEELRQLQNTLLKDYYPEVGADSVNRFFANAGEFQGR